MENAFSILKDILVSKLKVEPEHVTPDATPGEVELDSLAAAELAVVLTMEFGITVTDDELLAMDNIGAMARLIEQRSTAA